jgi:hypothetical protein
MYVNCLPGKKGHSMINIKPRTGDMPGPRQTMAARGGNRLAGTLLSCDLA